MAGQNLLIRADANAEIGVGHVMRCIALAQAWRDHGGRAIFALARGARELESRICSHGGEAASIDGEPGTQQDASALLKLAEYYRADWVVLDGYSFSSEYRQGLEAANSSLLIIADGGQIVRGACDIIVDPDPVSADQPREGEACAEVLLGSQYALIRREFLEATPASQVAPEKAKRILVTLGGGDFHNVSLQLLRAFERICDLELDLTVIVGPSNPHLASLREFAGRCRHSVQLLSAVANMPELMAQADMAVTAGGGTCYELAFLGVPMLLITTARNQERFVQALYTASAGFDAGRYSSIGDEKLAVSLRKLICDQHLRNRLAENARRMVDGKGAERIVAKMHAVRRGSGRPNPQTAMRGD